MNKKKPESIDELACAIKFDFKEYRKTELIRYKSDLAAIMLKKIHLGEFSANEKGDLKKDDQLSQNWKINDYNGEVFTKAFKSALENYGKLDEKTGERIPFERIFISHYTIKKPQVKVDRYKENNYNVEIKLKTNAIKLLLQQQAKELANKRLPDDLKIEKFDDCVVFLRSLNADVEATEKAINKLTDLYMDRYVQRVRPVLGENEDEEISMADFAGQEQVREAVVDKIAYGLDKALSDISNFKDKSLEQYACYYITMKIILRYKINGFNNQIIDEYVDKDLEKLYFEKYSQYEDEKYVKDIVADYTGKRPDTVRKKLDKVKKLIQNSMLKNISR